MKKLSTLLAILLFVVSSCNNFGKKYWYGSTQRSANGVRQVTESYVSKKQKEMCEDAEGILNSIADKNFSVLIEYFGNESFYESYDAFVTLKNTEYNITLTWDGVTGYVLVQEHVTIGKGWNRIYKSEPIYNFNSAKNEYERQRDYYVRMLEKE